MSQTKTPRSARYFRLEDDNNNLLVSPRSARFENVNKRLTHKYDTYCEDLKHESERTKTLKKIDIATSEVNMKKQILVSREVNHINAKLQLESANETLKKMEKRYEKILSELKAVKEKHDEYQKNNVLIDRKSSGLQDRLDLILHLNNEIRINEKEIQILNKNIKNKKLLKNKRNKYLQDLIERIDEIKLKDKTHLPEIDEKFHRSKLNTLTKEYEMAVLVSQAQHDEISKLHDQIESSRSVEKKNTELTEKCEDFDRKIKHLTNLIAKEKKSNRVMESNLNDESIYSNDKEIMQLEAEKHVLFKKVQKEAKLFKISQNALASSNDRTNKTLQGLYSLDKKLKGVIENLKKGKDEEEVLGDVVELKKYLKYQTEVLGSRKKLKSIRKEVKDKDKEVEKLERNLNVFRLSKGSGKRKNEKKYDDLMTTCEKMEIELIEKEKFFEKKVFNFESEIETLKRKIYELKVPKKKRGDEIKLIRKK